MYISTLETEVRPKPDFDYDQLMTQVHDTTIDAPKRNEDNFRVNYFPNREGTIFIEFDVSVFLVRDALINDFNLIVESSNNTAGVNVEDEWIDGYYYYNKTVSSQLSAIPSEIYFVTP